MTTTTTTTKLNSYGGALAAEAIKAGVSRAAAESRAFYAQGHSMSGREAEEYCLNGYLAERPKTVKW